MKRKKKIKAADLPLFDPAAYLGDEEAIAAYLTDVLEANDAALLASALGDIARAHGMSVIAKKAGIAREALYKALRADSSAFRHDQQRLRRARRGPAWRPWPPPRSHSGTRGRCRSSCHGRPCRRRRGRGGA